MKRYFLLLFCLSFLFLFITACSESLDKDDEIKKNVNNNFSSNITAEIVKSDILNDIRYIQNPYTIELVSWDLGYSGHALTKGDEVLCIKFHVINGSEKQHYIGDFFSPKFFLDGIEITTFISDFYGDGSSNNISLATELREGAEADVYFCLDCNVLESHIIEIDLMELEEHSDYVVTTENVLATFSFEIE